jgi:hypothetical protein
VSRIVYTPLLELHSVPSHTELFNMLVNPNTDAFSLGWHRDDVKATADEEEERERLAITHYGVSLVGLVDTSAVLTRPTGTMEHVRNSERWRDSERISPSHQPSRHSVVRCTTTPVWKRYLHLIVAFALPRSAKQVSKKVVEAICLERVRVSCDHAKVGSSL